MLECASKIDINACEDWAIRQSARLEVIYPSIKIRKELRNLALQENFQEVSEV
jgi:hypothetical protein